MNAQVLADSLEASNLRWLRVMRALGTAATLLVIERHVVDSGEPTDEAIVDAVAHLNRARFALLRARGWWAA